jgi:hypothetical protein
VWYVAFGSNLLASRFRAYLGGGPVPHAPGVLQAGARDPSPPRADAEAEIPHRLYFARSSITWGGGGVAFLDPDPSPPGVTTQCRLWLITAQQFADVYAQENQLDQPPAVDELLDAERMATDPVLHRERWYGRLLPLGDGPDGHPMITFTAPTTDVHRPRAAHRSYLRVVGAGLMERLGYDPAGAAGYLASRDGNRGVVDVDDLARDLELELGPGSSV